MGLFFISLYFILAGMVIFGVFGHIPSHYNSQKKSPQPSKFEQKLKESAQKSHEERLQAEEKLKQTQEKLAQIKAEKAKENRRKEEEILFHVDTRLARILQQGEQVLLLLGGEVLILVQLGLDPDIKRMLVQIAGFALPHQRCGIDRHGHKRVCGQDAAVIRAAAAGNNQHGRRRKARQLQRS